MRTRRPEPDRLTERANTRISVKLLRLVSAARIAMINALGLKSDFVNKSIAVLATQMVGGFLALAGQLLLARLLGMELFGALSLMLAATGIAAFVLPLGLQGVCLKYVAEESGKPPRIHSLPLFRFSILVTLAAVVISAIFAKPTIEALWQSASISAGVLLLYSGACALQSICQEIYRGLERPVKGLLPSLVYRPVSLALAGLIAVHFAVGAEVSVTLLISGILQLGVAIHQCTALDRVLCSLSSRRETAFRWPRDGGLWMKVALPLLIFGAARLILGRIDLIVLGSMWDASQTGLFAAALRVADISNFVTLAIASQYGAKIPSLVASNNIDGLRSLVGGVTKVTLMCALVVSAFLALAGTDILDMFGDGFSDAYPILLLLLVGQIVTSVTGPISLLLNTTGRERACAMVFVCMVPIAIVVSCVFCYKLGALGAALSYMVTTAIWNIALIIIVWREFGIVSIAFQSTKRLK